MTPKDFLKISIGLFVLAGAVFLLSIYSSKSDKEKEKRLAAEKNDTGTMNSSESTVENSPESTSTSMKKTYDREPDLILVPNVDYKAVLKTSKGDVTIDLFEKTVPVTVNNFVFLAKDNFYDGTIFHRIIKNFMIQGGDPSGNGTGGPGYRFADESLEGEYLAGTIAMANSGADTNGSQFFIMHKDYPLPNNYVIFGRAVDDESLRVIDELANTPVTANAFGENSQPVEAITLESVTILEN